MLERTTSPPSRAERKAALAMAQAVREMTLVRRDGVPFPDVAEGGPGCERPDAGASPNAS